MEKPAKPSAPSKARGGGSGPSGGTGTNSRKQDWIGRQLQRAFEDVAREPVPDDIMSLLDQLDTVEKPASEKPKSSNGSDQP